MVLLDNFGKTVFIKGKENDKQHINYYIDDILPNLSTNKNMPGFLKYRAINLTEKRNNKWEDTLYEKYSTAKGKGGNILPDLDEIIRPSSAFS